METPLILPAKGFTINMFATPVPRYPDEVTKDYVRFQNAKTRKHVESNYETGYVFGAFASVGVTNLFPYKGGMTVFFVRDVDYSELVRCLETEFLVTPRRYAHRTTSRILVHSAALARTLEPFGKGTERTVPPQYLVDNKRYLLGVRDGIVDYGGNREDDRDVINKRQFNPRNKKIVQVIEKHLGVDGQY